MYYYTVYKTTNLINNKIYIGCHKTKDLNDDYLGSGKMIGYAIKKYGKENFKKEILEIFDNTDDMINMESVLVNEEFVKRQDTYNISLGGIYCEKQLLKAAKLGNKAYVKKLKNDEEFRKDVCKHLKVISKLGLKKRKELYPEGVWKDRQHTEKTKQKQSIANKGKYAGKNNPQYGTMFITNLQIKKSIRIPSVDYYLYEQQGWVVGRNRWNAVEKLLINTSNERKRKEKIEKERILYNDIFIEYLQSEYTSIRQFCKFVFNGNHTPKFLSKKFNKYVDGYAGLSKPGRYTSNKELLVKHFML